MKTYAKRRIESVTMEHLDSKSTSCDTRTCTSESLDDPNNEPSRPDTWVYPLVQMAPFDIDMDEKVTQQFLQRCPHGSRISMASAYFNLTPSYIDTILASEAKFDIYAASPSVSTTLKTSFIRVHCKVSHCGDRFSEFSHYIDKSLFITLSSICMLSGQWLFTSQLPPQQNSVRLHTYLEELFQSCSTREAVRPCFYIRV